MSQPPAGRRTMQGLGLRVVTALVLAGAVVALFTVCPLWLVAAVFAAVAGVAMYEFTGLTSPAGRDWPAWAGVALAAAMPLAALGGSGALLGALAASAALVTLARCLGAGELASAWPAAASLGWGLAYAGGLVGCLVALAGLPAGGGLLALFVVFCVAGADIGAYFAGHRLGRRKLAPRLSPGKTLEGLAGGLLASAVVGAAYAGLLLADTSATAGAVLGLALGAVGAAGDLLESAFKRAAGAKDSGSILPGHGGLLDRIDGIIVAAPLFLLCRELFWS